MNQQTLIMILAAIVVVVAVGLIAWITTLILRSRRLKKKFGPEYNYTMDRLGDRRTTEADLHEREKRVVGLDIHPLDDHKKDQYHAEWSEILASFVDNPPLAVERANRLVTEVMIARGFPVADFEQRVADISVLYPDAAPKYRQANSITSKSLDGNASTEELRQAMVDYHSLFDQLLEFVHAGAPAKQLEAA